MLRFDILILLDQRKIFRRTALEKRTESRKTGKPQINVPG